MPNPFDCPIHTDGTLIVDVNDRKYLAPVDGKQCIRVNYKAHVLANWDWCGRVGPGARCV